jgi:hypothetical protein
MGRRRVENLLYIKAAAASYTTPEAGSKSICGHSGTLGQAIKCFHRTEIKLKANNIHLNKYFLL